MLWASWIEIPAVDLERAAAFYQMVFGLAETPRFEEAGQEIVLLRMSDKEVQRPGVSLVASPAHTPGTSGARINFHVGTHAALTAALDRVPEQGGVVEGALVNLGDGVQFIHVQDSEGNRIALSSHDEG